ncbi:hypothetical protein NPIL_675761, partial [Nephila pilipes]
MAATQRLAFYRKDAHQCSIRRRYVLVLSGGAVLRHVVAISFAQEFMANQLSDGSSDGTGLRWL